MALPSSGPISLNDIQNEFGGTNPIGINEYYGVASGVPASGTISFDDFYGTSAGPTTNGLQLYLDPGNTNSYSGSGTSYNDLSSNGNDGTLSSSGITYSSSTNGGIFTLASGGEISFGTSPTNIAGVTNNFTFQGYIKPDNNTSRKGIFGAYRSTSSGRIPNWLRIDNNRLRWYTNAPNNNTYQTISGPLLTLGSWQHVTITVAGPILNSCDVKFYIDGSLSTTTSCAPPGTAATGIDYKIGENSFGISDQYTGDIGVFLFYNRVLSTTEISDNYDLFKSRYGLT